jgi:two-component system, NarL family, nitrate/nitrite response regulator NarL
MVSRMPPERARITVLLVEDHLLVAEGLAAMLRATGDLQVVGTAATPAEAVRLAAVHQPDVVVMDSHLPDGSGADVAGRIRENQPQVALVFLSADESEVAMIAAVRAGACAYLPKSRATADVVDAVRRAAEGEMLIPAAQLARLLARSQEMARDEGERRRLLDGLTPREKEVLALTASASPPFAVTSRTSWRSWTPTPSWRRSPAPPAMDCWMPPRPAPSSRPAVAGGNPPPKAR